MTELAATLKRLTAWLARWRPLWEHRPFVAMPCPWERDHPDVSAWLRSLDGVAVERLNNDVGGLRQGPTALRDWVDEGLSLTALPPSQHKPLPNLREHWEWQVSGRKRAQVRAMAGAVLAQTRQPPATARWVDWCSGKGHLGRALGVAGGAEVLFVERQSALCEMAESRALREGVTARANQADVLLTAPDLPVGWAIASLHACGALTDAAIRAALTANARELALVPCCYHYHPNEAELPLRSQAGRAAPLIIAPRQLRFATAEEVAAPPRRRRLRQREEEYRLALDGLRCRADGDLAGLGTYRHLPPVSRRWLSMPFGDWARRVAREHGIALTKQWNEEEALSRGVERAAQARALGLVRTPFRRALELWCVLDRALWLQDVGYEVTLQILCPRAVSPRNLLICAYR